MFRRPAALLLPALTGSTTWLTARARTPACSTAAVCSTAMAKPEAANASLKIVTYNVRRFTSADKQSTVSAIGDALAALEPTVVTLNEVDVRLRPEALTAIAERLGGFSIAFFGHVRGQYGNALLSKYPIRAIRETHLRGGTQMGFPAGTRKMNGDIAKEGELHRIARGLLECDIELAAGRVITIAVTHLDHINEAERELQLEHLLEALGPNRERAIVVGDLNALDRDDYSQEEWTTLEERATANRWSGPVSGCLERLRKAGFLDSFVSSRGGGALSSRSDAGDNPIFSAHVGHPLYRIDYCFVSAASGLDPVASQVHADINLSDHFPVSFDFLIAPVAARL